MKTILVGSTEIEVMSCNAYTYSQGRGEKVLQFKVSAENATFETLKSVLENNEQAIQYREDDNLVCEYVGYGVFEAQYKNGVYDVEMHKTTITEQMNALLNANERLLAANDALQQTSDMLVEQNAVLAEQNTMLEFTMAEIMEVTIPAMLEEMLMASAAHDEALAAQSEVLSVQGESLAAQGEMLTTLDERLQFVEAIVTAGEEETGEPVTE